MEIKGTLDDLISCPAVYGLEESITAAGLPFTEQYQSGNFKAAVKLLKHQEADKPLDRAVRLSTCPMGTGHDNFLCGIIVQFNLTAPRYLWHEVQRYHFMDIVSCTSTMHTLARTMERCLKADNKDTALEILAGYMHCNAPKEIAEAFLDYAYRVLKSPMTENDKLNHLKLALPEGWKQTGRITTNYRQLKTVYAQRHNHRLQEWKTFCQWIKKELPMSHLIVPNAEEQK